MSGYDKDGNWTPPRRELYLYPHHCAPEDVAALVRRLEALADPQREAMPSFADTDWRSLAGISARVIKYLSGSDWRHGV